MLQTGIHAHGLRAAMLLGAAALPGTAHAATILWGGSFGGSYNSAANWVGGVVPGPSDTAVINQGQADISSGNYTTTALNIGSAGALRLSAASTLTTTTVVNNGSINLLAGNFRATPGVAMTVSGTGFIVLGVPTVTLFQNMNAKIALGAGQTVTGTGRILNNAGFLINQGTIRSSGAGITIDAQGTNAGFSGTGVGTGGKAGLYNSGSLIAGGATMTLNGGLYENAASGVMAADGSNFTMQAGASLTNLASFRLLKGTYSARAGTLALRGSAINLQFLGINDTTTDTVVRLSGATSMITVTSDTGTNTLESKLSVINASGRLEILDGRAYTTGSSLLNQGIIQIGGTMGQADSTLTVFELGNQGSIYGHGSIQTLVANSVSPVSGTDGIVRASEGTLTLAGLTGGTAQSDVGATLDLAAGVTTPNLLINNGAIVIGTNVIAVTTDYQNAGFGSGNAFNARANVTGTGAINAAGATQTLSATGLAGTTLDLGVQRVGATTRTLTITNDGTLTTLRGAVQNTNAPGVGVTGADFTIAANGGTANAVLSYGSASGDFAGQSLTVANNFDNVADTTLMLTGKVTQVSIAELFKAAGLGTLTATGANSYTLDLGSFAAGTQTITTDFGVLNNIALTTFSENLAGVFGGAGGPFSLTGASFSNIGGSMAYTGGRLSFATAGLAAGDYSSTVLLDTFSRFLGLDDLALSRISIDVNATITGSVGAAVPEPRVWAQLLAGFAMIGLTTRRRRRNVALS